MARCVAEASQTHSIRICQWYGDIEHRVVYPLVRSEKPFTSCASLKGMICYNEEMNR